MNDSEPESFRSGSGFPWPGSLQEQINWIAREAERCRATAARLTEKDAPALPDRTLRLMDGEWLRVVPIPGMEALIKSALWAARHWVESASSWCPQGSAPALLPRKNCPACAAGIKPSNLTVWVLVVVESVYDFENRRWGISQDRGTWLLPLTAANYAKKRQDLDRGDCIWSADRASGYGIRLERHGSYRWTEQAQHEVRSRFPIPLVRVDRAALKVIAEPRKGEQWRKSKH
jgi:hypothetical protein